MGTDEIEKAHRKWLPPKREDGGVEKIMKPKKVFRPVESLDSCEAIIARMGKVNESLAKALVERDLEIERLRRRIAQLSGVLVEVR